jgi:hypothetical protein
VTAGYSGTPLAKKLGIQENGRVLLSNAPRGFKAALAPLPKGVNFSSAARVPASQDVIVYFTKSAAELSGSFARLEKALAQGGGLWIAWPKKASKVATDLDENIVREVGLAHGVVDNKVCAIDEIWSGLRFMRRRAASRAGGASSPPR